jgi:hypothetical protein
VDSVRPLEYAVAMAAPPNTDLENQLRLWIKKNEKESSRLEFKLKLEVSNPGRKAEFIRDVIALANSEGEAPREEGHLVIGFSEGRFHDKNEHYEGATLGQILDSHIFPAVSYALKAFEVEGNSIHVLVIKADTEAVHVASKKLQDDRMTAAVYSCRRGSPGDGRRTARLTLAASRSMSASRK